MADRKLGIGTTLLLVVGFIVLIAWAYGEYGGGDVLDELGDDVRVFSTSTVPPTVAPATTQPLTPTTPAPAPLVPATAAPAGGVATAAPVVVPSTRPVTGVVVDHDVTGVGTADQKWILQIFDRATDSMVYALVDEATWRSCPVPGEIVQGKCVDMRTYEPELPFPP